MEPCDIRWRSWGDSLSIPVEFQQDPSLMKAPVKSSQICKTRVKRHHKAIRKEELNPCVRILIQKLPDSKFSFVKTVTHMPTEPKFTSLGSLRTNHCSDDESCSYVGLLTKRERKEKVDRYLLKRKRRKWIRRINYHSRKWVADTRPRFKGRFVSVSQAGHLLEEYWKEMEEKAWKERMFAI